jgi:hypothetical protein
MEQQNLTKQQKALINAGLDALAALEEGIRVSSKLGEKRVSENMQELCKLVEEMMYSSKEEAEKNFDRIMKEMEDRADMLIGQTILAKCKYGIKK